MNEYRYYIKKTEKPVADIVVLELADVRGVQTFDFKPGQYVMICYRNSNGHMEEKHTFSIASSPLKKDSIRLGIRIMGKFTTGLSRLKVGQEIFVSGPFGSFVFDEEKQKEAVFIAGGVGITPFVSSLAYVADKKLLNRLDLLYSCRTMKGAVFAQEIMKIGEKNDNIRALFSITEEKLDHKPENVITERISADAIKKFVGHSYGKTFFLCGPVPFMDAMRRNLAAIGVHESQIQAEEFSMIPDASLWLRTRNMAYALGLVSVIFALVFYLIQNFTKHNGATATAIPVNQSTNTTSVNQSIDITSGTVGVNQAPPQQSPVPVPSRRTRTS